MTVVLDASMALSWCLPDERSSEGALRRVQDEGAVAPSLWRLEIANALAVAERRGRLTEAQSARAQSLLGRLPLTIVVDVPPVSDLVATAIRHELSAYDASYLMLALERGLALATGDSRLRQAAEAAGIRLA